MSCKCKNYLTSIGKPKNKIDCIAWLLLNVFGCKFCETCRDEPCNKKDGEPCTDNIANYIREAVKEENKPTADVVEVRHGGWVPTRMENHACSLCHDKYHFTYPYCPSCGAKMDGERSKKC